MLDYEPRSVGSAAPTSSLPSKEAVISSVLIVDDDRGIVSLVRLILGSEAISVEKAYSGEEGLLFLADGHDRRPT